MKSLSVILLLLFPSFSLAEDKCMESAISNAEIAECASQELDRAESALDATYKAVLARLDQLASEGEPGAMEAKQQLIAAQRIWLEFREVDCDVVFLLNAAGSVRIPATSRCMTKHTLQRNLELQQIFD